MFESQHVTPGVREAVAVDGTGYSPVSNDRRNRIDEVLVEHVVPVARILLVGGARPGRDRSA